MPNAGSEQLGPVSQGQMSQAQVAANVDKLAARLKQNPNDPQGWTMLARSYMMLERFSDAASAYEKLTALSANDADALADYALAHVLSIIKNIACNPYKTNNNSLHIY